MALRILLLLTFGPLALAQSVGKLDLHGVKAESTVYRGKQAVHVTELPPQQGEVPASAVPTTETTFAIVNGSDLQDGTIEADLAGAPAPGAAGAVRGFIGIAFRLQQAASHFELFYLRPTNGRADDQLRRNHSTQYVSAPDWTWQRMRKDTPGLYESYVDLEAGVWTHVKIVVSGGKARLYVNGAAQPCLIVNDLKLPPQKGGVALWVGPGTDGYFANLSVQPGR
jgi:Concanavalin A-like lectin/glucanases superfamily